MTFLDLFSGIGGFRLGMEQAGHYCLGHCEIDKFANISYAAIHQPKESEFFATDIRSIDPGQLPEADCYCGGFPCQSFSIAGKRGGFDDTRGTLFFEVMRLAEVRKPRLLFLENVEGLTNHDNGRTFETIIRTLDELGYDAEWQVLNSKNFGVPQNRERVFIIGHLRGTSFREVFPIFGTGGEAYVKQLGNFMPTKTRDNPNQGRVYDIDGIAPGLTKMDGGGREPYVVIGKDGREKQKDYASCLTGGGHSGGNHSDMDLIVYQKTHSATTTIHTNETGTLQSARLDKVPAIVQPVLTPDRPEKRQNGRRFKNDGEEMFTLTAQDRHGVMIKCMKVGASQSDRIYGEDGIAPTIRRGSDKSGTVTPLINSNARIRRLTPRECFRLQGFPDWAFDRAKWIHKEEAAAILAKYPKHFNKKQHRQFTREQRIERMSDSQLYKQAGNSVTVNVIYEIAIRLI